MAHVHTYERQPHLYGALPLQYLQGTSIATTKTPPTWQPEYAQNRDYAYDIDEYIKDIHRWCAATEVAVERQGPLVSLALGGAARAVADALPTDLLQHGGIVNLADGQGEVYHTGVALLLFALKRRFPVNGETAMLKAGMEFLSFKPRHGETIQSMFLRLDRLLTKANQVADLHISWAFRSWLMMSMLRLPARKWSQFLDRCGNRFPRTEAEYRQLEDLIVREHTLEDTLYQMSSVRSSLTRPADHWDGQRYFMDGTDEEHAADGHYYADDGENPEEGYSTSSEQWEHEGLADPYTADRISAEHSKAMQNPAYAAQLYWAARKAVRRHRAAVGRFGPRRHFQRRRKGKGKGKGSGKGKKGFNPVMPFTTSSGKAKGDGAVSKGKSSSYYQEEAAEPPVQIDDAWWNDPADGEWHEYSHHELSYDEADAYSQAYAVKGKSKSKTKGKDVCHLCGQKGHWKNECPLKAPAMFTETQHTMTTSSSSPIMELNQHVPAFYYDSDAIPNDDPLQLGTCWPGDECREEDVFSPDSVAFMNTQAEVAVPSTSDAGMGAFLASLPSASSVPVEETMTINVPVHGEVTLSGTVQLRLPAHMSQHVVSAHMHTGTVAGRLSTAAAAAPMTAQANPSTASAASASVQPTSTQQVNSSQHTWTKNGKKYCSLDVLGGATVAIGGRPTQQRRNAQNTRAPPSLENQAEVGTGTGMQSRPASATALESSTQPLERADTEESYFVHTIDLLDGDCTSAWTVMDPVSTQSAYNSNMETQNHSKAKLHSVETLLPDTGAVDNLIGLNTARRFAAAARQQQSKVQWSRLQRPRLISGVGGRPAIAHYQVSIEGKLPTGRSLIYTAPVVGDASADVPALLGLREMSRAGIINIPSEKKLCFIKDVKKVQWPSDAFFVDMAESASGHQLLPFLSSNTTKSMMSSTPSYAILASRTEHEVCAVTSASELPNPETNDQPHLDIASVPTPKSVRFEHGSQTAESTTVEPTTTSYLQVPLLQATTELTSQEKATVMDVVEDLLLNKTIPLAPQCTNLYDPETDRHRSLLLGVHTTRGTGITRATRENADLLKALHSLASTRQKGRRSSPYAAIQLTVADCIGLPAHQDQHNDSKTDIIAFGSYTGGLLWVSSKAGKTSCPQRTIDGKVVEPKGTAHDIHRKWTTFEGVRWHATTPHKGHRVSAAFYLPGGMDKLDQKVVTELISLGFPLSLSSVHTNPASSYLSMAPTNSRPSVLNPTKSQISMSIALLAEDLHFTELQLKALGGHVVARASSHLHMHRALPQDLQFFLSEVKDSKPQVVWIQYRGSGMPGRRTQVRNFRHYVRDLLQSHPEACLLIECRSSDLPVREEIMQSDAWNSLVQPVRVVRGCNLHESAYCCGYMVRATFALPAASTCSRTCVRRGSTSASSPSVPDTTTLPPSDPGAYWLRYLYDHIAAALTDSAPTAPAQDLHPQAPPPSSEIAPVTSTVTAAYPTDAALRHRLSTQERRLRKQPRLQEAHYDDCGSDFEHLLAPQVEAKDPPSSFFVFLAHTAEIKEAKPNNDRTWLASRRALQSHAVQQCLSVPLTAQCKVNCDVLEDTFYVPHVVDPIDSLVSQAYESHWTDLRNAAFPLWLAQEYNLDQMMFLNSSDKTRLATSTFWARAYDEHQKCGDQTQIHVMELFGGQGGVIQCAIRRRLRAGLNIDLVTGFDVQQPRIRQQVWQYVHKTRPTLIVMSPPCTAFCAWSRLNRVNHPKTWQLSMQVGSACSRLASQLAAEQMRMGRHFIVEQPAGSTMFTRSEWQSLGQAQRIYKVSFPQCAVGLRSPLGRPIRKMTTLLASDAQLLRSFQTLRCECVQPHLPLAGTEAGVALTKWAATWPPALCQHIVQGLCHLLRQKMQYPLRHSSYPVADADEVQGTGLPPLPPPSEAPIQLDPFRRCPGCRRRLEMTHPMHTRQVGSCRYPRTLAVHRSCPACQRGLPLSSPQHTQQEDCRALNAARKDWIGRLRVPGAPERGGRISIPPNAVPPGSAALPGDLMDLEQDLQERDEFQQELALADDGDHTHPEAQGMLAPLLTPLGPMALDDAQEAQMIEQAMTQQDVPRAPHLRDDGTMHDPTASSSAVRGIEHGAANDTNRGPLTIPATPAVVSTPRGDGTGMRTPRGPDLRPRERRVFVDAATQQETLPAVDWRQFDSNRAIRQLSSANERIRALTLRRLHVRWYHAGPTQMRRILAAAGVTGAALAECAAVCQTCNVCRQWSRPADRAIAAHRPVAKFNEEVQQDLIHYQPLATPTPSPAVTILHMIDVATRFSVTALLPSRSEQDLCSTIAVAWIAVFGTPQTLVSDEESGLHGAYAADFAERNGLQLRFKAPRQEAAIAERHNQGLREQLHRTETQMQAEGKVAEFKQTLALVTHIKNAVTTIAGYSPFTAVFGRQASFLPDLENPPTTGSTLADESRIREIAVLSIVEENSRQRLSRAMRHQTRPSGEELDYKVGDLVDIWFPPGTKEIPGWKGPARLVSVQPSEGHLTVRWQGRTLDRRLAEARKHISYLAFWTNNTPISSLWTWFRSEVESRSTGSLLLGYVLTQRGWAPTSTLKEVQNQTLYAIGVYLCTSLGIPTPITIRVSRGTLSTQHLSEYSACEVWAWRRGRSCVELQYWLETRHASTTADKPCLPLRSWAQLLQKESWEEVQFMEIWHLPDADVQQLVILEQQNQSTPAEAPMESVQTRTAPPVQQQLPCVQNIDNAPVPASLQPADGPHRDDAPQGNAMATPQRAVQSHGSRSRTTYSHSSRGKSEVMGTDTRGNPPPSPPRPPTALQRTPMLPSAASSRSRTQYGSESQPSTTDEC
eukprot:6491208-Amphidinium_carterae.2